MNRAIRQLRCDLEKPRPKGYEPFDKYAYNAFSWQAAYWMVYAKSVEERAEAFRLRDVACQKSREAAAV